VHNYTLWCQCHPEDSACKSSSKPAESSLVPTTSAKSNAVTTPAATTVYVTKTGSKYHRAGCSSLRYSAIPMSLDEAAKSYGPCSRCSPPTPSPSSRTAEASHSVGSEPASRQCAAITKSGKRCSRSAAEGSIYCWQHQK